MKPIIWVAVFLSACQGGFGDISTVEATPTPSTSIQSPFPITTPTATIKPIQTITPSPTPSFSRILNNLIEQYAEQGIEVELKEDGDDLLLVSSETKYVYVVNDGHSSVQGIDQEWILAYASEEEVFAVMDGSLTMYDREREEFAEVELPEGGKSTGVPTYLGQHKESLYVLDENVIASHKLEDGEWTSYERPVYYMADPEFLDLSLLQEYADNPVDVSSVLRMNNGEGDNLAFGFYDFRTNIDTHEPSMVMSFVVRGTVDRENNRSSVVLENPATYWRELWALPTFTQSGNFTSAFALPESMNVNEWIPKSLLYKTIYDGFKSGRLDGSQVILTFTGTNLRGLEGERLETSIAYNKRIADLMDVIMTGGEPDLVDGISVDQGAWVLPGHLLEP